MQRLAVTLACALAVLCTPFAAFGQTQAGRGTSSGTAGIREQTDVANLPVCGQPSASTESMAARRKPSAKRPGSGSRNTASAKRRGKGRGAQRKRATARRGRARRAQSRRTAANSTAQEPVRATLTLDQEDQETVTAAAFGRSTDPQPLTLVYRVSGCRVTDELALPLSPLPTGPIRTTGARPLPLGAVQIDDVDADGDRYVVHLRVFVSSDKASQQGGSAQPSATTTATPGGDGATGSSSGDTSVPISSADTFTVEPGSYTSFVRLKAGWLRTVATPVTVTRSEDTEAVPILIGFVGGLCGFGLFMLLRAIHGDKLLVKEQWVLWMVAIVSVVVGAGTAFFTNYFNQDVWTFDANGLALFTAAFSASTAGVAAGLLTGIYKTETAIQGGTTTGGAGTTGATGTSGGARTTSDK